MTIASPFSRFALFSCLALSGCTGADQDQLTLATSASDAVVMSTAVGTWVGTTPDGPVTLTICEDPARLVDVPPLPDALRCPEIAHEVRGVGRSPAEMVDLAPQEETSDDFFQGETTRTCDRVMAAPLAMRLDSWCAPAVVHGALVLADRPMSDPYVGPWQLAFEAPKAVGSTVLLGTLSAAGEMRAEYETGLYCSAPACPPDDPNAEHCVPRDGALPRSPSVVIELHRSGPAKCPIGE